MALAHVKRRRLLGKQSVPDADPVPGVNTSETRNAVITFVRDGWVAQQMQNRALGCGHWDHVPLFGLVEQNRGDVSAALRAHATTQQIWDGFQSFGHSLKQRFGLERLTLAMELHTQVSMEAGYPSVHLHLMFDSRKSVSLSREALLFMSCVPYISTDAPRARGKACRQAFNQGYYYLQAPKIGSIFSYTTCAAFEVFAVSFEWVTALWATNKITARSAEDQFVRAKKHIKAYLDNVKAWESSQKQQRVAEMKAAAATALLPLRKETVRLQQVDSEFLPQFQRPMFRRKFLVLDGPSRLGKTVFANSLAGAEKTLEANCANTHLSPRRPDLLQLGGEPEAPKPWRAGEAVARLDHFRHGQGSCRPHDRVEPGGAANLANVQSDLPPNCRAPGAPPPEQLGTLLKPRTEYPYSSRAHVPVPVPFIRKARRLRMAPDPEVQELLASPQTAKLLQPVAGVDRWPKEAAVDRGPEARRGARVRATFRRVPQASELTLGVVPG
ncbi:unnamed protein product [Effrenium voratum]|uniref:Uncharacterized protein n=1 Tax=Effrenium voratum TaxID=2562239 RepID=A0AA36JC71_9DINO|nr:unnamed protein product [Effrenium voratum]